MNSPLKVAVAAIVLSCSAVYAEERKVHLPVKVEKSDLIAKVEVLSTTQVVPYYVKSETGAVVARDLEPGEYRSQAEVKVIRSIKGVQEGQVYVLEFDNDSVCPNVWYKKGDVCLVFNTKRANGHYETFNTYYGKYMVATTRSLSGGRFQSSPRHSMT
jgi:hypothetical protein